MWWMPVRLLVWLSGLLAARHVLPSAAVAAVAEKPAHGGAQVGSL